MCGIAGIISRKPLSPMDVQAIRRANAAMFHRGPDGAGEYIVRSDGRAMDIRAHGAIRTVQDATPHSVGSFADDNPHPLPASRSDSSSSQIDFDYSAGFLVDSPAHLFLAMRRLAIIDLNGGWQPLYNENRSLVLIANGEIYNYKELRHRLQSSGRHEFRTNSDCECILHLYEEFGLDFVQHLRGMYAFALWDSKRKKLIVVRDRMGEKPLYVRLDDSHLVFASELKALLATDFVPKNIDPLSVNRYMHFGWVPEPATMIEGIRKLSPGHMLVVDLLEWKIDDITYWRLEDAPLIGGSPSDRIRAELERIVELTVQSDRPVGIALSGGLDSSIIAALARKKGLESLQAFSVGYQGRPVQDERSRAKEFADSLCIPIHEIEIETGEIVDSFPQLVRDRDDPIADIAGHGYYALSRHARGKNTPVLLQGQGGDELFWGYPWVLRALGASKLKRHGASRLRYGFHGIVGPTMFSREGAVDIARFVVGWSMGWRQFPGIDGRSNNDPILYEVNDAYERGRFIARNVLTQGIRDKVFEDSSTAGLILPSQMANTDVSIIAMLCTSYLLQNGVAQGDRLAMANSVELRLPLVDYRLSEIVVGLHKARPDSAVGPKQWLLDAVKDLIPESIRNRPKQGFNPPVTDWFSGIRERYSGLLSDGVLVSNGIVDISVVPRLTRNASRLTAWNEGSFRTTLLEVWCREMCITSVASL